MKDLSRYNKAVSREEITAGLIGAGVIIRLIIYKLGG